MKRRTLITALTVGVAALIMAGGVLFSSFVHDSLWEKSVTDVLEVTAQGQNALDTYFEKDLDTSTCSPKSFPRKAPPTPRASTRRSPCSIRTMTTPRTCA